MTAPVEDSPEDLQTSYSGRWIAKLEGKIVGHGGTPDQARAAAKSLRHKEEPAIEFVTSDDLLPLHPLVDDIAAIVPPDRQIFLVGGAVRDALRGQISHDLDFVLPEGSIEIARQVADRLGGAFYPLDPERGYGRVILTNPDASRTFLDFTPFQGDSLEADLRRRDFTINAIAIDIHDRSKTYDPLGGVNDLREKRLRACYPQAFLDDSVRVLRAVRLAAAFDLHIPRETRAQIREAVRTLSSVSAERIRDELFRILDGPRRAAAIRALDLLGVLPKVLPELAELKGVRQSPPHTLDVWEHTLQVLDQLEKLLDTLKVIPDPEAAANLQFGLISLRLGRFREQIKEHFSVRLNQDRPYRPLLFLSALYHDTGKPSTFQEDPDGRVRFLNHEKVSARLASQRCHALQLSNAEIERVKRIVRSHMRPIWLAMSEGELTRRAVYRFFRDLDAVGVDVCLLSLADVAGTYGTALPQNVWERQIEIVRMLLQAYWEEQKALISPVPLLKGNDLIEALDLSEGPVIGKLLEAIREAQAEGKISDRQQALDFARLILTGDKYEDDEELSKDQG